MSTPPDSRPDTDPAIDPTPRLTRDQLFARRIRFAAAWLLLSAGEGIAVYMAFMKLSENPSREVAFFLAASTCWVVGNEELNEANMPATGLFGWIGPA